MAKSACSLRADQLMSDCITPSSALDIMDITLRTVRIGNSAENYQRKQAEFKAGSKSSENVCKTKNEISNETISGNKWQKRCRDLLGLLFPMGHEPGTGTGPAQNLLHAVDLRLATPDRLVRAMPLQFVETDRAQAARHSMAKHQHRSAPRTGLS